MQVVAQGNEEGKNFMSRNDISWAREWLPPRMITMVGAQFVDAPAVPADAPPALCTFTSPYPFDAGAVGRTTFPARPHLIGLVSFLPSFLVGRHVGPQHGI